MSEPNYVSLEDFASHFGDDGEAIPGWVHPSLLSTFTVPGPSSPPKRPPGVQPIRYRFDRDQCRSIHAIRPLLWYQRQAHPSQMDDPGNL